MGKLNWPKCSHNRAICAECIRPGDDAKRFADGISLICTFTPFIERVHSWVAVKLADGTMDLNLYPSKVEAIRHQVNEFLSAYLCLRNVPDGISVRDAAIWLQLHRYAYDQGMRLADPDERAIIMPLGREQKITRA